MNEEKKKLLTEIENAIFPSKEEDSIGHVDFSYSEFISKLRKLAD